MGRKLRLSVHRKNEFRKKQAKKQRYTVTVRESLPISLTLDKVTVLKISIPKDMLLVSSINELSCRLQTMAVVPKGEYNYVHVKLLVLSLFLIILGWITLPTQSSCRQCFVRCEEDILGNFQVSLSVTINPDMSWEASVQGHKLLPSCGVFSSLPQVVRTVSDIKTVLHYVDSCCICVGNDDEKFEPLVSSRKGNFMDSSGMLCLNCNVLSYQNYCVVGTSRVAYYDSERKTIRRDDCTLLISGENVKRCGSCEEYRQNLNRMLYRYEHSKGKDPDKADHHSHTNYRYLTSPEKVQRMMALHSQMRICKRHISRLYVCIDNLIEQRSVEVDDDLDKHLKSITEQYSSTIAESHPEGSFARSFWESQCKALSLKNMKSMRWDPVIIRWCLYLRHLSGSSAYEMLRESGVIKLPSQRTLRDYTYYTKAAAGFSDDVDKQLMEAAKIDACAEHEKFVVLLMDEMHIKEDLVYDKHSGTLLNCSVYNRYSCCYRFHYWIL